MNKLDKQIDKILTQTMKPKVWIDKENTGMQFFTASSDLEKIVSQIKQSILKAIMKKAPKKLQCDHTEHIEPCNDKEVVEINYIIDEFESVIKDLLSPKQSKTK